MYESHLDFQILPDDQYDYSRRFLASGRQLIKNGLYTDSPYTGSYAQPDFPTQIFEPDGTVKLWDYPGEGKITKTTVYAYTPPDDPPPAQEPLSYNIEESWIYVDNVTNVIWSPNDIPDYESLSLSDVDLAPDGYIFERNQWYYNPGPFAQYAFPVWIHFWHPYWSSYSEEPYVNGTIHDLYLANPETYKAFLFQRWHVIYRSYRYSYDIYRKIWKVPGIAPIVGLLAISAASMLTMTVGAPAPGRRPKK